MKKQILIILLLILAIGLYFANKHLSRIVTPDLKYNTVYSSNFEQLSFEELRLGMSKSQVFSIIGEPISIINPEFEHSILYSNQNLEIEPGGLGIAIKDTVQDLKFLRINFDKNEQIISVFNSGGFIDTSYVTKLNNSDYEFAITELGKPIQEFKCDCFCSVLVYSKLKDGNYSGKTPMIENKRIALDDNNKVKIIIDEVGNPYKSQLGICKQMKNGD